MLDQVDGDNMLLRNVGNYLSGGTPLHPRRLESSSAGSENLKSRGFRFSGTWRRYVVRRVVPVVPWAVRYVETSAQCHTPKDLNTLQPPPPPQWDLQISQHKLSQILTFSFITSAKINCSWLNVVHWPQKIQPKSCDMCDYFPYPNFYLHARHMWHIVWVAAVKWE